MKRLPLILVLVFVSVSVAHAEMVPTFPDTGANPQAFVPKGYSILKQAEGDLNNDGLPDVALALKSNDEAKPVQDREIDPPRYLIILFKTPQGYQKSIATPNGILTIDSGGVYGDPFDSMNIAKGVLNIVSYGGSAHRWGGTERWRYQDGDWYLIGQLIHNEYNFGPEKKSFDTNFLTGLQITDETDKLGVRNVNKTNIGKKALTKLSGYQNINQ